MNAAQFTTDRRRYLLIKYLIIFLKIIFHIDHNSNDLYVLTALYNIGMKLSNPNGMYRMNLHSFERGSSILLYSSYV